MGILKAILAFPKMIIKDPNPAGTVGGHSQGWQGVGRAYGRGERSGAAHRTCLMRIRRVVSFLCMATITPSHSHFRALILGAVLLLAPPAIAAPTGCPRHFTGGQAPDLTNPKLTPKTPALCYTGYTVVHSGLTRTPLYSAEHLTADRIEAARGLKRENTFHPARPR